MRTEVGYAYSQNWKGVKAAMGKNPGNFTRRFEVR